MFDPLHKWLGIPPDEQPPNHYRLLGITMFEHDMDVIDVAADKQLAFLHELTNGEYAEQAEQLSNQVSAARLCLRNREKKLAYDETLRGQQDRSNQPPIAAASIPNPTATSGPAAIPNPTANPSRPVDPGYDVSSPPQVAPGSPSVRVGRNRPTKKAASPSRLFWQVATFMCVVAIALIGVGIKQGRFVINGSMLEAMGVSSPGQTDPPDVAIPVPTDRPPSPTTGEPNAPTRQAVTPRGAAQSVVKSSTKEPPADPARHSESQPSPPPRRSLGDLANSIKTAEDAKPIVKSPLPSESQVEEKLQQIRELYQAEYRDAKTSAQKIELAKLMHRVGQETADDPIGRFALWRVARDIMVREGEYNAALAIVDNLDSHFLGLDANGLKVETLRDSSSHVADTQIADFLRAIENVVAICRSQEQFDLAISLGQFAQQDLGGRLSESQRSALERSVTEAKVAHDSFTRYQEAMVELKQSPESPEANQDAGRYLCWIRGECQEGLKYLSLGSDSAARAAALQEIAPPSNASQWIALADAWFDVAESTSEPFEQSMIRQHALEVYRNVKEDAKGLERRQVDTQIARLEELLPSRSFDPAGSDSDSPTVLGYRVMTSPESRSDFANRKGNQFTIGMGSRPDGLGEAEAGIELQGVKKLTVVGSASHNDMPEIDPYSKAGFVVDYHTPGGYSKRVFLGLGLRPGRQFTDGPPWGTAKPPHESTDIGRAASYEIDLERWAPSTWDGRIWFTVFMQNAGPNRALNATVSW